MHRPARVTLSLRDLSLLAVLTWNPLTVRELHSLSQAFEAPFATEHRLRQRLRRLEAGGFVRRCAASTPTPGTLGYYVLRRDGFRILNDADIPVPPRRLFRPVGPSREAHTLLLGEVIVHLLRSARDTGGYFRDFHRENSLTLDIEGERLRPDAAFDVGFPDGRIYSYYVEVDRCTEPLWSDSECSSLERKIRLYEAWANRCPHRFRVLFLTRGGRARVERALDLASSAARNPERALVYGATTAAFLRAHAFRAVVFRDHRRRPVSLLASDRIPG